MAIYTEDDLLPLSALQHLLFCPRQCALIHIEQVWQENLFTAQGRLLHDRVDQGGRESRGDVRIESGMPLRSLRLGLIGKADVVEFHRPEHGGLWQPFPVEYKRGTAKKENWDKVQLCAQAICLEEMLGLAVPSGALFYGKNRRRQDVFFSDALRRETEETAAQLHALMAAGRTPSPVYTKRCDSCSFYEICLPKALEKRRKIGWYLAQACEGQ
ncbi:MAG: CRISPR-associated protein Cas4 [Thermodesulfobacteriota bacterium]